MPATYAIATIHPAPGHEMEALSNVRDVKAIIAKHDPMTRSGERSGTRLVPRSSGVAG